MNLADLYRTLGQDKQGEEVLQAALATVSEQAHVLHAYGLLLIRNQRYAEAVKRLGQAARAAPRQRALQFCLRPRLAENRQHEKGLHRPDRRP